MNEMATRLYLERKPGLAGLQLDEKTGAFKATCVICRAPFSARHELPLLAAHSDHHELVHHGVMTGVLTRKGDDG